MRRPRFRRSVSNYPAYTHTSYNVDFGRDGGHLRGTISLHVRHSFGAWRQGGFWFGIRPQFEIHRAEDKVRQRLESMRYAKTMYLCESCGAEEWGEPGWKPPEGWEHIGRREFCKACAGTKTLAELA